MRPFPDLEQSTQRLKSISRDLPQSSFPKLIANVYLGAIGLLLHLKKDQRILLELRYGRVAYKRHLWWTNCSRPELLFPPDQTLKRVKRSHFPVLISFLLSDLLFQTLNYSEPFSGRLEGVARSSARMRHSPTLPLQVESAPNHSIQMMALPASC